MRAGRLVAMLRLLQARGRMLASALARELEVSERTIFRDIEALSGAGVPVYAVRGPLGGFELMGHLDVDLPMPEIQSGPHAAAAVRIRVRLSPHGRRMVAVLGRPAGLRVRTRRAADGEGWFEASAWVPSLAGAVPDLLALGADVEVLRPAELRELVRGAAEDVARLYALRG